MLRKTHWPVDRLPPPPPHMKTEMSQLNMLKKQFTDQWRPFADRPVPVWSLVSWPLVV